MSKSMIDLINVLFDSETPPSQETLSHLVQETVQFATGLREKFESKDPEERENAVREAEEIQKVLEAKMEVLARKSGLDLSQLLAMMEGVQPASLDALEEGGDLVNEMTHRLAQLQQTGKASKTYRSILR